MTNRFFSRTFPWRLYRKIYASLITLLLISFAIVALLAVLFDPDYFLSSHTLWAAGVYVLVSVVFGALVAYRLTSPLARVLAKTLKLAHKKTDYSIADSNEDLFDNEPGEYYELEKALDRIAQKLKKRRAQLAHEREESQALMGALADAVVSLDRDEKIKYFNSQFATQFLDPLLIRVFRDEGELKLMDVFRDKDLLAVIRQTLKTGEAHNLQRVLSTKLDPAGRSFSLSASPLKEEKSRQVYGALVLLHDITDLKSTDKMRSEFVENASHELRTPLTSIRGYVSMAKEDAEQGRYEALPQFLTIISKSVDRLMELVNDLLTISLMENSSHLSLEKIDVREVTEEVLERLSPIASDKRIMIKAHFEIHELKANHRLLDQVLSNLLGNAIKYMSEGGHIEIVWDRTTDESSQTWIRLRVKDNGPGIAEEHQARLFERFYRIDKGRSRDVGGTGLGLAIVKHVVLAHGGEISVKSRVGQGAQFTCLFPMS